jgi:hypothetical protein
MVITNATKGSCGCVGITSSRLESGLVVVGVMVDVGATGGTVTVVTVVLAGDTVGSVVA